MWGRDWAQLPEKLRQTLAIALASARPQYRRPFQRDTPGITPLLSPFQTVHKQYLAFAAICTARTSKKMEGAHKMRSILSG